MCVLASKNRAKLRVTCPLTPVSLPRDEQYVRLPLSAAKRLRVFSKGDVGEIIARHLEEKGELLGEIHALRDALAAHAPARFPAPAQPVR